jgi:hypothetical protein
VAGASIAMSAIRISHGWCRRSRIGCGGPPPPGRRMNAMRRPSGDQRGDMSRFVVGSIHWIGVTLSR